MFKMFKLNKNKNIPLFLFIVFAIAILVFVADFPLVAQAQSTSTSPTTQPPAQTGSGGEFSLAGIVANKIVRPVVETTLNLLNLTIIQPIIFLFSRLINFAFNINNQLFAPNNIFIQNGWKLTRDIANLGFVLIIIVIAFATILRMESYGVKKTLAKLIIAALLVNFSMMICAAIFDFSNVFTNVFLRGFGNVGDTLITVLGAESLLKMTDSEITGALGITLAGVVVGPVFILIFLIIIVLILALLFIMLLIRYVWLGLLIILSPLAWLCSILPATAKWWKTWWNHFLRWIIFAPAMAFFLYLALNVGSVESTKTIVNTAANSSFGGAFGSTIGNLFIMTGLLLGGLFIANSFGITGAKQFQKWATAGAAGIGAFVGSRIGAKTLQATQGMAERFKTAGAERGKALRVLGAPIRRAGFEMSRAHSKLSSGLIEAQEKRMEKMSKNDLITIIKTGNAEQKMAAFNLLAKKNSLDELGSNEISMIQNIAGRFGKTKDVIKEIDRQVPHLSTDVVKATDPVKALAAKLAKLKEEDLGKLSFSHMLKDEETSKITIPAILANSQEDLKLISTALKSLNMNQRQDFKTKIVNITTSQPEAHKDFINLTMKSKNLLIRKIGEEHNARIKH